MAYKADFRQQTFRQQKAPGRLSVFRLQGLSTSFVPPHTPIIYSAANPVGVGVGQFTEWHVTEWYV